MRRLSSQVTATILILLVSLSAAILVTWLVPSLSAASLNMLFRFRGSVPAPDDIVIVAVDDASLQRVGNWPWPRSRMASVLDRLSEAHPRVVGLDVIYAETSNPAEDKLLAEAITRNARVVLPAQLTDVETAKPDSGGFSSAWLLPLQEIRRGAAATGHAHAAPDVDGVLRTVQLSKADAKGERLWAFGLETLRVAEQISPEEIEERAATLRVGRYEIPIHDEAEKSSLPGVTIIRSNEMLINYLGPPGTFPYYSIMDVLDGKVPASTFNNKIVLVGAVAQTLGDTRITPFISYGSVERQSGTGMSGVEVHANVIETIRRGAWLNPRPDWTGFIITLLVILGAGVIVRLLDGWRVIALLCALLILIIAGSLYVFNHYFIIPPVVSMLTGFMTVVPLLLLNNSITASHDLDRKLDRLARIQKRFMSHRAPEDSISTPLSFLCSILRADTVALFKKGSSGQALKLFAFAGRAPREIESLTETNTGSASEVLSRSLRVPLVDEAGLTGLLLVERIAGEPFSESEVELAHEFAVGLSASQRAAEQNAQLQKPTLPLSLPHNLNWKLRAVDEIASHLIARIGFMSQVFTSMTDGLLVADITGQVVFANPAALRFWDGQHERANITGKSLTELFVERGIIDADGLLDTMRNVMRGQNVLMDIELRGLEGRFFTLQFSTVTASDDPYMTLSSEDNGSHTPARKQAGIIGLIVIITDVTKRRELERIRAETLQLVSHELRTPLTSIRGLSELLLKYPVPADASPEILETIYAEAVRMNELINRYLDVTRIEADAQLLSRQPLNVNKLITECVRALSSPAAEKGIQINLKLEEPSVIVFADGPLLTQAINNLLSNAIKYSPSGSLVEIGAGCDEARVLIYVRDHGYGIPHEFQDRVFDKFYRLERDARSETVGTGLGLPLVKEIVERHGGQVTLESEPDTGSTFTIHLPLQRD